MPEQPPEQRAAARFPAWCHRARRHAVGWWNRLCDLVYAPHCALCGVSLPDAEVVSLCQTCRRELLPSRGPRCRRCAQRVPEEFAGSEKRCPHCRKEKLRFASGVALGSYSGLLRQAVLRLKYPGEEALARALIELFWHEQQMALAQLSLDLIAPVPMHWGRRLRRGTNSPELLAEFLSARLGVPVARRLLIRQRNTLPQADLLPSQRIQNVRGAFCLGKGYALCAARVLLVDDILTTGATCNAAAACLRRGDAATVHVAVLARADHTL